MDGLERLAGIESITVSLQTGIVTLTPAADRAPDLAAIPALVRRAGFQPSTLRIHARGNREDTADGPAFRIAGWPTALPLVGEATAGQDPAARDPTGATNANRSVAPDASQLWSAEVIVQDGRAQLRALTLADTPLPPPGVR